MRERIPAIHIKVPHPILFITKIARIAETINSFSVTRGNDNTLVSIRFNDYTKIKDCSVHIRSDGSKKIHVELQTSGEDLTFEEYRAAATAIINPLLIIYNLEESTQYRLSVSSQETVKPKFGEKTAKLFSYFTKAANRTRLSISDWRLFYEFVHSCRTDVSADDLASLLANEGFSEQLCVHVANIFQHLQDFRARKRNRAETATYYMVTMDWERPASEP